MPLVAASEDGTGQTESAGVSQLEMWCMAYHNAPVIVTQSPLERGSIEGERPVEEAMMGKVAARVGRPGYDVRRWEASTPNPKYSISPIAYEYCEGKLKRTRDRE